MCIHYLNSIILNNNCVSDAVHVQLNEQLLARVEELEKESRRTKATSEHLKLAVEQYAARVEVLERVVTRQDARISELESAPHPQRVMNISREEMVKQSLPIDNVSQLQGQKV